QAKETQEVNVQGRDAPVPASHSELPSRPKHGPGRKAQQRATAVAPMTKGANGKHSKMRRVAAAVARSTRPKKVTNTAAHAHQTSEPESAPLNACRTDDG